MDQSQKNPKPENSYDFFLQIQWKHFVLEFTDPNDVLPQLHLAAIFCYFWQQKNSSSTKCILKLLLFF